MDLPYEWCQALFCRDSGLCTRAEQDWGSANADPVRISQVAEYYLAHPEYSRVGREMLIECVLESASERMRAAALSPHEVMLLHRAVERAIRDTYDPDVVTIYWEVIDRPGDPNPLYWWIREHFHDWRPSLSVWSERA